MIPRLKLFRCSFIVLMLLQQDVESRKKPKVLLFISARTHFNPKYLDEYYIDIKSGNTTLDFAFTLNKDLPQDLFCLLTIEAKSRTIYAYDVNACSVLRQEWTNKLNIITFWLQNVLLRYGDLPKKCPIQKGTYTWRNLKPDRNSIPSFATSGRYRANVTFYLRMEKLKDMMCNCSIEIVIT